MATNPMFGPGMLDRHREPHTLCKCFPAVWHYDGIGVDCLLTMICFPWACIMWKPTLRKQGDQSAGTVNPHPFAASGDGKMGKGMMDRDREPHIITSCLCNAGGLVACEYDGAFTLWHIIFLLLGWLPCLNLVWKPVLDESVKPMVGKAVAATYS